ncbi:hypothetical protein B0H16DRAFT_1787448 [Mycena metata]|uniref:Uncharacterized protein n=1 Tax=Mycena metata TaxID=1033252 RepID=A0AAD7NN90_9AGAR|nr:hypothetical protein B0H16DRAFT_1787448 [Mycena metata]
MTSAGMHTPSNPRRRSFVLASSAYEGPISPPIRCFCTVRAPCQVDAGLCIYPHLERRKLTCSVSLLGTHSVRLLVGRSLRRLRILGEMERRERSTFRAADTYARSSGPPAYRRIARDLSYPPLSHLVSHTDFVALANDRFRYARFLRVLRLLASPCFPRPRRATDAHPRPAEPMIQPPEEDTMGLDVSTRGMLPASFLSSSSMPLHISTPGPNHTLCDGGVLGSAERGASGIATVVLGGPDALLRSARAHPTRSAVTSNASNSFPLPPRSSSAQPPPLLLRRCRLFGRLQTIALSLDFASEMPW